VPGVEELDVGRIEEGEAGAEAVGARRRPTLLVDDDDAPADVGAVLGARTPLPPAADTQATIDGGAARG